MSYILCYICSIFYVMNPFAVTHYRGPIYFCDRAEETAAIIEAIRSNRSITLYAIRRIGKTGLIHHVFEAMKKEDENSEGIYIDILDTKDENDFINKLIGASLGIFTVSYTHLTLPTKA